jgi:hypothetical protein
LLAVLMDFCSGSPMQFLSGVDTLARAFTAWIAAEAYKNRA